MAAVHTRLSSDVFVCMHVRARLPVRMRVCVRARARACRVKEMAAVHTRLMPYSCVWVAHDDCLNFGAIRYLKNHEQVRAAAGAGHSLAAAPQGRACAGPGAAGRGGGGGDGGGDGADSEVWGTEADARLCSIDKRIHQTVHAMQHVARQRVLVVLTSPSGAGGAEPGLHHPDLRKNGSSGTGRPSGVDAATPSGRASEGWGPAGAGGAGGGGGSSKQCAMRIFADDSLDEVWRVMCGVCGGWCRVSACVVVCMYARVCR